MEFNTLFILHSIVALILALSAHFSQRFPHTPSVRPFRVFVRLGFAVNIVYAFSFALQEQNLRIFLLNLSYTPAFFLPIAGIFFALEYTNTPRPQRLLLYLSIVPLIGTAFSLTGPLHSLFNYNFKLSPSWALPVLSSQKGPIYWLLALYTNAISLITLYIFIKNIVKGLGSRRNSVILTIGLCLPYIANLFFQARLCIHSGYNVAPLFLLFSAVAYYFALLRYQLFGLVPLARSLVIENLNDGILVFDEHNRLVDYNAIALSWLDIQVIRDASRNILHIESEWAGYIKEMLELNLTRNEYQLPIDGAKHWIQFDLSLIPTNKEHAQGKIFTLRNIDDIKARESEIHSLVAQKDTLIREIHHRIKNNMAVISSILSLQAAKLDNPEAIDALTKAKNRVQSMGLLYEKLYKSMGAATTTMDRYMGSLVQSIVHNLDGESKAVLDYQFPPIPFNSHFLFPLGILLNELISNSFKYAYGNTEPLHIEIRAFQEGREIRLFYQDNGPTWDSKSQLESGSSFGLQLIQSMVGQLRGEFELDSRNGTNWSFVFPM